MGRKIEAVIFDWAGTTVDYGCFAPVQAFVAAFEEYGITPTLDEVREPMGMLKRDHIRTMMNMERIHEEWKRVHGKDFTEEDVEQVYQTSENSILKIVHQFAEPKPYVLEMVKYLRDKGIALPAGLCLVSPGAEMFDPNELKQALIREPNNAVLQQSFAFSTMYTNGHGLDEPYMSPNRGSYRGFPPMLIQTGGIDFCRDMSLRCANQAAAEGVDVKLHSWEFMPHVFFLLHDIPEAEEGRNELAEFIESALK